MESYKLNNLDEVAHNKRNKTKNNEEWRERLKRIRENKRKIIDYYLKLNPNNETRPMTTEDIELSYEWVGKF